MAEILNSLHLSDGGDDCGVHGRNWQGKYFTILQDAGGNFGGETSGLAFSPDGMFMYVAFQRPGHIFEIKRTDGRPFHGQRLDIKYHQATDNEHAFEGARRQLPKDKISCHVPSRESSSSNKGAQTCHQPPNHAS